ncbi:MAG TPA: hypothetical protein EYQ50_24665 [Verrucomicrobiales bacterium]|nr:hypothetical protein [Verrucomicrobiales bacterium]
MNSKSIVKKFLMTLCCIVLGASILPADDWPGWSGRLGTGISTESNLPLAWGPDKNIHWKIDIPGKGMSSPVIVGDRIYLTTQTGDNGLHVIAIDRLKGGILWDRKIGAGRLKTHDFHNMATPTPTADSSNVWALFGTGDMVCLTKDGEQIWKRNLQKDHGKYEIMWGMGTSPVMHGNRLFVACMHQGPSYVLAVDSITGKDIWKKLRQPESKGEALDSYSSPVILPTDQGTQLIVSGADHINAYDVDSGNEIWISSGLQVPHPYGRSISGPTANQEMIVTVASGFQNRGKVMALKTGGHGIITDSHLAWTMDRFSPDCPSPIIYKGLVYFIRDDGIASCIDLKSGEPHWQERLFKNNVKVSPVAGDNKIYFMSGQGSCKVLKAGPKMDVLAENDLDENTLCTPAISQGSLYIRTEHRLYSVGL